MRPCAGAEMAVTVRESEGLPASYPASPVGLSLKALALDRAFLWQRIESWIARRWPSRSVTYIAEGPGWWAPRLYPFTASTTERWQDANWIACTLDPTPFGGLELPGEGPYRIAGTAGDDSAPPAAVTEAHRRLAEYLAGATDGEVEQAMTSASEGDYRFERPATWLARSMQLSGAADLLRPYRGLGAA